MIDNHHCTTEKYRLREKQDCTVRAAACALQIDYASMRDYLASYGRRPGKGMCGDTFMTALRDLGVRLQKLDGPKYRIDTTYVPGHWYRTRDGLDTFRHGFWKRTRRKVRAGNDYNATTVRTLARELTAGTYLVTTVGHVLCLRDGVVQDWTKNRLTRIETVWQVIV